jgi:hypothetical protein
MGPRKTVSALASALVSLLLLGVCASAASAQPLSMGFTEARANVGVQLSDEALFAAPDTAPFAAQIDPATGSISNGVLGVPDFETHIEEPIEADVTVDFNIGQITGSFDQATGALSLTGVAGGTLTASGNPTYDGEQCTVLAEPSPITLTTAGSSGGTNPRSGVPFADGLAGSGAIAGEWQNMSAEPVEPGVVKNENFCADVENRIGGPGGIWMEQEDLVPPSAPQLTSTDPASPGGLSGTPRILGSAEAGSTVRVYAGAGCTGTPVATGSAAELGSPGIAVAVAQGTATFSATATDAAGNTSPCSAPISYTRFEGDPGAKCIVPKLAGKTLARARTALQAAHCSVGKVHRPKHKKGKRLGPLVVKSSKPSAGTTLAAGSKVNLKLGPKPHKARHS